MDLAALRVEVQFLEDLREALRPFATRRRHNKWEFQLLSTELGEVFWGTEFGRSLNDTVGISLYFVGLGPTESQTAPGRAPRKSQKTRSSFSKIRRLGASSTLT